MSTTITGYDELISEIDFAVFPVGQEYGTIHKYK